MPTGTSSLQASCLHHLAGRLFGHMHIDRGGIEPRVPQPFLELKRAHPGLGFVRGEGVPQTMRRDFLAVSCWGLLWLCLAYRHNIRRSGRVGNEDPTSQRTSRFTAAKRRPLRLSSEKSSIGILYSYSCPRSRISTNARYLPDK